MAVWQRHPLLSAILGVALFTTFLLFNPFSAGPTPPLVSYVYPDADLPQRLQRAHAIYDRMLGLRKGMIDKFGPDPKDIAMFPPNKEPWPAYTGWDFFPPSFNCPHELERAGAMGDGGKWTCGLSRLVNKPNCVVYSFGVAYDSSFESSVLQHTHHCQVWGYANPSVDVKPFDYDVPRSLHHRTHYTSSIGLVGEDAGYHRELLPLHKIMTKNGHMHIDILRIDVEGWEFAVLRQIVDEYRERNEPLPFGQLLLELHGWNRHFTDFLELWESLEAAGLRPFMSESNLVYANYNKGSDADLAEYSFLNTQGDNVFIADPPMSLFKVDDSESSKEKQRDIAKIRHAIQQA